MSVLLFGRIDTNGNWIGEWYFPKNRHKSRRFSYSRTGDTVDKELIDYVSFTRTSLDPPQGRKRGRKGKRQGRLSDTSAEQRKQESRYVFQESFKYF
jgi:hypothetical protein